MKRKFTLLAMVLLAALTGRVNAQIVFQVLEPANISGTYGFTNPTDWSLPLLPPANARMALGVLVDDGTVGDSLGCNDLVNGAALSGKIAFIYRGECNFSLKVKKAQDAGAIGAIIINNQPGIINMTAGAEGPSITIPTMCIEMETGARLRAALLNGTLKVFMGNKTGYYRNDVGTKPGDIIRPENFAMPKNLIQNVADYPVHVGGWVRNIGNGAQNNVTLRATITKNGAVLYNKSGVGGNLTSGDSAEVLLDDFILPDNNLAEYVLTYRVTADSVDQDSTDNIIKQSFFVSESVLSKSRFNFTTNEPVTTTFNKLAASGGNDNNKIRWGILFEAKSGSRMRASSIKFSAATLANSGISLAGKNVSAKIFEWNDLNGDGFGMTDDEIQELPGTGFFTFATDSQQKTIEVFFDGLSGPTPVDLADDKFYIAALEYEDPAVAVYFGTDQELNYFQTRNAYGHRVNPLLNTNAGETSWNEFAMGTILALSVQFVNNTFDIEESAANLNLSVFPNPASDLVNIRFGTALSKSKVQVDVLDLAGRSILNKQYNITDAQNLVGLNTAGLANGSYFIRVGVNGQTVKSMPLVIAK